MHVYFCYIICSIDRFNNECIRIKLFLVSGELPHKYKIVIAGNHDFSLEESVFSTDSGRAYLKERFQLKINHMLSYMAAKGVTSAKDLLTNATYLEDSEVTVFGIRLYGSPW